MPRKVYDDERLRSEALELRRQGLSYREIARRLGCSVYKVYELISGYESPRSRLRQAVELADKLEELASKIRALEEQVSKLQSSLSNVRALEELTGEVSRLRKEVEKLNDGIEWIRRSVSRRLRDDHNRCIWLDGDGYCTAWYYSEKLEGCDMRPDTVGGRTIYMLNVRKHPLICVACPSYKPRGY